MFKRLLGSLVILLFVAGCQKGAGDKIPVSELAKYPALNVWIDQLSFRKAPGLDSEKIDMIPLGDTVYYLGESSDMTTKVTIRCTEWNTNWLKVARSDGSVGWVYAGGVRDAAVAPLEKPMRIVIAYYPNNEAYYSTSEALNDEELQTYGVGFMEGMRNEVMNRNRELHIHIYFKNVYADTADCVALGDENYPEYYFNLTQYMKEDFGFTEECKNYFGVFLIEEGKKPQYFGVDYGMEQYLDDYFGFNQNR